MEKDKDIQKDIEQGLSKISCLLEEAKSNISSDAKKKSFLVAFGLSIIVFFKNISILILKAIDWIF